MATTNGILVDTRTGKTINVGDQVKTFRDEDAIVTGWRLGYTPESTGRVYLHMIEGDYDQEFYPGVIEASVREHPSEEL